MANGLTGIDHVVLGLGALERGYETFRRLGFTLTPLGRHEGLGTGNYCIMFPDDYLELMGLVDSSLPGFNFEDLLERKGEGPLRLVFASQDVDATVKALRAQGIEAGEPRDVSRLVEGMRDPLRFRVADLPPETVPGADPFICQHLSADRLRRPEWLEHENTASGIHGITIVVEDPPALQDHFDTLFGAGSTAMTDDTLSVFIGSSALFFVTPDDLRVLNPGVRFGGRKQQPPYIGAVSVTVRDAEKAEKVLREAGIDYVRDIDGILRLPPQEAHGVLLELHAMRPSVGG